MKGKKKKNKIKKYKNGKIKEEEDLKGLREGEGG
jgi:hypothetical protein